MQGGVIRAGGFSNRDVIVGVDHAYHRSLDIEWVR